MRVYYPSQLAQYKTTHHPNLWPLWADDHYIRGFVRFMQAVVANWPDWCPRTEYWLYDQMSRLVPLMHIGCTYVWNLINGKVDHWFGRLSFNAI